MKIPMRIAAVASSLLLLSACGGPETPQEVTEAFWSAVADGDTGEVVEYSTLEDTAGYDQFSRKDWEQVDFSWGKAVIDGAEANIDTVLKNGETGDGEVSFSTWLVREDGQWKVDYGHTADDLRASSTLDDIMDKVGAFGRQLSDQIDHASRELDQNVKSMAEQFRALSRSIQDSTSETVERYSEQIRRQMDELAESIDRALEEHRDDVSEEDSRTLREVSHDLREGSESDRSIADSGDTLTTALQRLETVDSDTFAGYKERWTEWTDELERDVAQMLEAHSSNGSGNGV